MVDVPQIGKILVFLTKEKFSICGLKNLYTFCSRRDGSGSPPACQEEWKMCRKKRRIVMLM
jgi:hypothetical protein